MFNVQNPVTKNETSERPKIEAVVTDYFKGYLEADSEALKKAFLVESRLFATDEGKLEKTEVRDWLKNLEERRARGDIRTAEVEILGIDIAGDAAVAKTHLKFEKFSFTDYLSLLDFEGKWTIVNKIYTVQKN